MRILLPISLALTVAACATPMQRDVAVDIDRGVSEARELIEHAAATPAAPVYRDVDAAPGWYGTPIEDDATRGPAALAQPAGYGNPHGSLAAAIAVISRESNVTMQVTPDAVTRAAEFVDGAADGDGNFEFTHEAHSLRELLDVLTARTGTSWTWRHDRVLVYYLDTRVFDLDTLAATSVDDETVISNASATTSAEGGGGGGEGGGGQGAQVKSEAGSNQTTTVKYAMDLYGDIEKQVAVLLTKDGKASVSSSTGTLTVRDNAGVLAAVEDYVHGMNQRLKRQVVVELTVLTVTQNDSDAMGINWNIVRQGIGDYYRVGLSSLAESPLDAAGITATVVEPTSAWVGSEVLIEALRKVGNAKVERRLIVNAMNSRPSRVQAAGQDAFLINRTTAVVGESGTALSGFVTRDEITGLSLTLVPRILEDQSILLQVAADITAPIPAKRVTADGVQLELPRKTLDNILQSAHLKNGATLVLTGLQQDDLSTDQRGIGSAKFALFGGGSKAARAQRYVVILLTPRIAV